MLGLARRARTLSGSDNLCLAGGVALNVLANARILREAGFRNVWVQPAAGDSGGCTRAGTHLYPTVLRHSDRHSLEAGHLRPGLSQGQMPAFPAWQGVFYTGLP